METVLDSPKTAKRSILAQADYTKLPRYVIKAFRENESILGMARYEEGMGVKKDEQFPGENE